MKLKFEEMTETEYIANLDTHGKNVSYKVVTEGGTDVIYCMCGMRFRDPRASDRFHQHNLDGTHLRRMK